MINGNILARRSHLEQSSPVFFTWRLGNAHALYYGDFTRVSATEISNLFSVQVQPFFAGTYVLEVFANGVQIDNSPFLVDVRVRNCMREFGQDSHLTADEEGQCVCQQAVIAGMCVRFHTAVLTIVIPVASVVLLIVLGVWWYSRVKADALWSIDPDEVVLCKPLEVLGQGTHGIVVKAQYRGASVRAHVLVRRTEVVVCKSSEVLGQGALGIVVKAQYSWPKVRLCVHISALSGLEG